jgi:hypothetical protein
VENRVQVNLWENHGKILSKKDIKAINLLEEKVYTSSKKIDNTLIW